jgi:hypothetical protein
MSCDKCEQIQEDGKLKAYIRIGNANVEIVGCQDHLRDLIDLVRLGRGQPIS